MKFYVGSILFVSCAFIFILGGCATGEQVVSPAFMERNPERIAVAEVTGDIRGRTPKNQVGDFFAMELLNKGYQVVERERVESILQEQDFQKSERTNDQEAAQIGRILNVPAVLILSAHVEGEKVSMTGRMIDAETAEVLWIGTGRGGSGRTLATLLGTITGGLLGSEVGGGRGRIAATAAGGALGGAAGETLAPQTARVVQNAIKEMVKELPDR